MNPSRVCRAAGDAAIRLILGLRRIAGMLMGTGPSCTEVVDEVKVRESRRSTGKSDTVCDIRSDSGSISGAKVGTDMNQFFFLSATTVSTTQIKSYHVHESTMNKYLHQRDLGLSESHPYYSCVKIPGHVDYRGNAQVTRRGRHRKSRTKEGTSRRSRSKEHATHAFLPRNDKAVT